MISLLSLTSASNYQIMSPSLHSENDICYQELLFHNVDGYIMIDGAVDDVKGRFMLDTATPFNYLLNNNNIPLRKDVFIASGSAGSGQEISIFQQSSEVHVNAFYNQLGGHLDSVKHADFDFIQKGILPDFLGMIGHGVLHDKIFEINYQDQVISFLPKNERVICEADCITIDLEGSLEYPSAEFNIHGHTVTGYFDTGNLGGLELTKELELDLIDAGYLYVKTLNGSHGQPLNVGAYKSASLHGLYYSSSPLVSIGGLSFSNAGQNAIYFGYEILKNYISVWDLPNRKIYLKNKWGTNK